MSQRKVDLVVYDDGVRRVIGEAVVDLDSDGRYLDVSATIKDEHYKLSHSCSFSLGPKLGVVRDIEAAVIASPQDQKVSGKAPALPTLGKRDVSW